MTDALETFRAQMGVFETASLRFWAKVRKGSPDDCWEWTASRLPQGYGCFAISAEGSRKTWRAHRVAYILSTGQPIPDGMCVCHSCDNPPCCNPAHLWLGTTGENTRDMASKGRNVVPWRDPSTVNWSRGEAHYAAKLSDDDVRAICRLGDGGLGPVAIARRFGIHHAHARRLMDRANRRDAHVG